MALNPEAICPQPQELLTVCAAWSLVVTCCFPHPESTEDALGLDAQAGDKPGEVGG